MNFAKTSFSFRLILIVSFLSVSVLLAYSSCIAQEGVEQSTGRSGVTQVVMLGTGTPNAEPDRSGTSIAVVVNDVPYIVDFGPGVVRRASAAFRNGVKGLRPGNLKRAFLTHLHSDHTTGYPDLIFTPAVLERDAPLEVYGPPGIKAMTEHILKAYEEDVNLRIHGLEPTGMEGYKVFAHEIQPGVVYTDEHVTVKAFPVKHGSWDYAFGFRFETPDKVIVISGDTVPVESVIENSKNCDILIHEVYSQAGFDRRTPEWQKYHSQFHTSSIELGKIASEVQPKLLVLYHQLLWGSTPEELLAEIRSVYDGKVVYGRDLDVY